MMVRLHRRALAEQRRRAACLGVELRPRGRRTRPACACGVRGRRRPAGAGRGRRRGRRSAPASRGRPRAPACRARAPPASSASSRSVALARRRRRSRDARSCAVERRVEVGAAGEDQPVERVERLVDPVARSAARAAAARRRARPRARSRAARAPTRPPTTPQRAGVDVRRDPDRAASSALEQPLALLAGDDLVEEPLLGAARSSGSGRRPRRRAPRAPSCRASSAAIASRSDVREALGVRLVRVALERRRQLELVLDPVEAGRDQRREREVRVDVAARDPRLDPQRRPWPTMRKPHVRLSCPQASVVGAQRAGRVALVRVDRRREEDRQLARARDLAGEVLLEDVASRRRTRSRRRARGSSGCGTSCRSTCGRASP